MPWQLIFDHIGDRLLLSATSQAAGFEARNVEDGSRRTFWKATAATEQTFTYDAGVGKTADVSGVTIVRGDLLAAVNANVAVQWSNDAATGWTDIGTPRAPLAAGQLIGPDRRDYDEAFSGLAKRGWRLRVYGTMSAAPMFAALKLGRRITVPAPAWGGSIGPAWPDRGADLEFGFPLVDETTKDDMLAYVRAVSLGFPSEQPISTAAGAVYGGLTHFIRDTGTTLGPTQLRHVILVNPGELAPRIEQPGRWLFPPFRWRTVV